MSSKVEIWNLALSNLGIAKEVANETENSQERAACARFYDVAREATLRDFAWPFAGRYVALGLVASDPSEVDGEWAFSYRYPTDCLEIRKINSGLRNDTRQSRVPYKVSSDTSGRLIYTDMDSARLNYTAAITDTQQFPADFVLALAWRLSAYIAPRLTAGDPFKLGPRALQMYAAELAKARSNHLNEEQQDEEPDSEFIRAREGIQGSGQGQDWVAFPDRSSIS